MIGSPRGSSSLLADRVERRHGRIRRARRVGEFDALPVELEGGLLERLVSGRRLDRLAEEAEDHRLLARLGQLGEVGRRLHRRQRLRGHEALEVLHDVVHLARALILAAVLAMEDLQRWVSIHVLGRLLLLLGVDLGNGNRPALGLGVLRHLLKLRRECLALGTPLSVVVHERDGLGVDEALGRAVCEDEDAALGRLGSGAGEEQRSKQPLDHGSSRGRADSGPTQGFERGGRAQKPTSQLVAAGRLSDEEVGEGACVARQNRLSSDLMMPHSLSACGGVKVGDSSSIPWCLVLELTTSVLKHCQWLAIGKAIGNVAIGNVSLDGGTMGVPFREIQGQWVEIS